MLLRRQMEYTEIIREGGWRVLPAASTRSTARASRASARATSARSLPAACARSIPRADGVSRSGRANADFRRRSSRHGARSAPAGDRSSLHVSPSVSDTVNILNADRMALLPKGAYVVNVGRGTAIDQDALIASAGFGPPRRCGARCRRARTAACGSSAAQGQEPLLTPHVAGNMTLGYTCERNVQLFCENLENYAAGRPMHHLVDRRKGY